MRVLFTNFGVGKTSPLQKDDGGVIFVGSRLKPDSPPMAMTADTADFRPEARPMSTKLDWGHAWRSLQRLLADKEDTRQVFEIMRALNGASTANGYQRLLTTPEGGRIAFERQEF